MSRLRSALWSVPWAALILAAACSPAGNPRQTSSAAATSAAATSAAATSAVATSAAATSAAANTGAPVTSSSDPTSAPPAPPRTSRPPPNPLPARHDQLTPNGLWWGVDSTGPITDAALDNVRSWYRGSPRPLLWGRYVTGRFALRPGELAFARTHGIGVYLIVPDLDCSICDGGSDVCGNDRTADQARNDAHSAVRAATRLGLPDGVTLFKDVEQVGSCSGELTPEYLRAWYRYVRATRYRPAFYGNTYRQSWDFPRAYCAAVHADPHFAHDVVLAQDEPEPAIGAPRGAIGPRNAPRFAPYVPSCAPPGATKIWQYGESLTNENYTDVDEIIPGTRGLLAPDGSVT